MLDDAFISFRYAENVANGWGLVWNNGYPVEGYSNFLWVVLLAWGIKLGIQPEIFSHIISLSTFALCLSAIYILSQKLLKNTFASLLCVVATGLNYSFNSYATTGMETMPVTALFFCIIAFTITQNYKPIRLVFLSSLLGIMLLLRLDAILLIAPWIVFILVQIIRSSYNTYKSLVFFVLPALLILSPWFIWKYDFYGAIFPNTYYVKVASATSSVRGLIFVGVFFFSYTLYPHILFLIAGIKRILADRILRTIGASIALWLLYILIIGGDFMEFRFFIPIIPLITILFFWLLCNLTKQKALLFLCLLSFFITNLYHLNLFPLYAKRLQIDSVGSYFQRPGMELWHKIGKKLNVFFSQSDVSIAVAPAGAIPYYSKLQTLDLHGLNDIYIARNGLRISDRPGHQRMAPIDYILNENTTLIIGNPKIRDLSHERDPFKDFSHADAASYIHTEPSLLPDQVTIIAIPIDHNLVLLAWYAHAHPDVEEYIQKGVFTVKQFSRVEAAQ